MENGKTTDTYTASLEQRLSALAAERDNLAGVVEKMRKTHCMLAVTGAGRAPAGARKKELPLLPQPPGSIPYGHCLLPAGDMPTVGNRSRKMVYGCILTYSGLLRQEARRAAAA